MTTIYDIAKEVGCAPSTVSKYITKHGYVSQQLGNKIAKAMIKLDYHYNGIARELSNKASNRLGIIVPFLDHPYFQSLIHSITEAATSQHKEVVIMPTNYEPAKESQYLSELEHQLVDALIITSHVLPVAQIRSFNKYGPLVFCENNNPQDSSLIVQTTRQTTSKALFQELRRQHLTTIGFTFIRHPHDSQTTRETLQAYKAVFKQPIPEKMITYGKGFTAGKAALQQLRQISPDLQVLLTESDITAAGAFEVAKHNRIKIIGQGNSLLSQLLGFSSIDQHLDLVGNKAVELALGQTDNPHPTINFEVVWR